MLSFHLTRPNENAPAYSFLTSESSSYSMTWTNEDGDETLYSESWQEGRTEAAGGWSTTFSRTASWTRYLSHPAATETASSTYAQGDTITPASSNGTYNLFVIYATQVAEGPGDTTETAAEAGGTGVALASLTVTFLTSLLSTWETTVSTTVSTEVATTTLETGLSEGRPSFTTYSNGSTTARTTTDTTYVSSQEVASGTYVVTNTPVELGTVFRTNEKNEWLWAATFTPDLGDYGNITPSFLTDCASAVTETSYWPVVSSRAVLYAVGEGTGTTFFGQDATLQTVTETLIVDAPEEERVATSTEGGFFSRDTTTTAVPKQTTTTSTTEYGRSSVGLTAYGIYNTTVVDYEIDMDTIPQAYLADGVNFSTCPSVLTWAKMTSYTANSAIIHTFHYQSGTANVSIEEKSSTETFAIGPRLLDVEQLGEFGFSVYRDELKRFPARNAFRAPHQIQQDDPVATNLNASPRIFYPFASSVQEAVETPVIYRKRHSAIDADNGVTWQYSWGTNQSQVSYTKRTATDVPPETGVADFGIGAAADEYYITAANNHTVMGGFGVYSESQETAYRSPAGWKRTTVFGDGAISTDKYNASTRETFTVSTGNLVIETRIPTVIPRPDYWATPDVFAFTRNGSF